jgi:hypothetical protein
MKKAWQPLGENIIFRLCKKVLDVPAETKLWKEVACCVCGTGLRATVNATNAAAKLGVDLNPICFDCAKRGPEYVLNKVSGCAKVSRERKG